MRDEEVVVAVAVEVPGVHAHPGLRGAVEGEGGAAIEGHLAERTVPVVQPEEVLHLVVGHEEVDPPVPVQVGGHHPQAVAALAEDPGVGGDVLEGPVPAVAHQAVGEGGEGARAAVVEPALHREAGLVDGEREVHVAGHKEVQAPVAVEVQEGRARRPAGVVGPRLRRHVAEGAVAEVAEELVGPEAGHVEVRPTVAVVVARGHALAVAAGRDPARRGDVGEVEAAAAVEVVPIEPVRVGAGAGLRAAATRVSGRLEAPRLHEVDVEVAVVVVVDEGRARAGDLGEVVGAGASAVVYEVEARLRRHVHEPAGRGPLGPPRRPSVHEGQPRPHGYGGQRGAPRPRPSARVPLRRDRPVDLKPTHSAPLGASGTPRDGERPRGSPLSGRACRWAGPAALARCCLLSRGRRPGWAGGSPCRARWPWRP